MCSGEVVGEFGMCLVWGPQGESGADILVAFQVMPEQEADFRERAVELGYKYQDERENEFIRLFRKRK